MALIAATGLAMAELAHGNYGPSAGLYGGHPDRGGIVGAGCSLAILWAVLAIDFGGIRALLKRDRKAAPDAPPRS